MFSPLCSAVIWLIANFTWMWGELSDLDKHGEWGETFEMSGEVAKYGCLKRALCCCFGWDLIPHGVLDARVNHGYTTEGVAACV